MMHNFDDYLFSLAKASIEHALKHGAALVLNPRLQSEQASQLAEVGVSISIGKTSLGCQVNIFNKLPMHKAVTENAYCAGFKDSRFKNVNKNILSKATLELTFLSDNKKSVSGLCLGELSDKIELDDTVFLLSGRDSSVMFSSMQTHYLNTKDYLQAIRSKANIPDTVAWQSITAVLIKTKTLTAKPYSEIKCLNINS